MARPGAFPDSRTRFSAPGMPAMAVATGREMARPPGPTIAWPTGWADATPPSPAIAIATGLASATEAFSGGGLIETESLPETRLLNFNPTEIS